MTEEADSQERDAEAGGRETPASEAPATEPPRPKPPRVFRLEESAKGGLSSAEIARLDEIFESERDEPESP